MARAIITNRIYLDNTPQLQQKLLKELTYKIPNYRPEVPPKVVSTLRIIDEKLLAIPSGRVDLIPPEYEIEDRRNSIKADFPEFRFELRESQRAVYDDIDDDAFINAWTSWGKTFTGLAIAGKFGYKTLIIVHTSTIRDNWVKECEKVYGFTPGIVGGGQFDTSQPITIAMIQTLSRRKRALYRELFGTVIVDECHHCPAKTYMDTLDGINARYKIGLSATSERKDGMHVLFSDFFSKNRYTPPKENYMEPTVDIISLPFLVPDGTMSWAEKVNELTYNEEYQRSLALIAASYASKGHKVLVVASRKRLLKRCHDLTPNSVLVTGETKNREELIQEVAEGKAKVLYGSINIFSEGVSINQLSVVILGTPLNNNPLLEQIVGRIIRLFPGKLDPIVVDINLKGKTVTKQAQLRKGYYMSQGYEIRYI